MRLGLFGGTFDPPHVGHLLAATDAYEALALTRVLWIPTATQPFKVGAVTASAEHRVAMLERALADDPRFTVEPIEVARSGVSFTVETVTALAARQPGAELVLLLGADAAAQFDQWREPSRIRALAEVVILARAGSDAGVSISGARRLDSRLVDVSATEIRARVRAGKSIRGFVTDAVAAYIASAGLYR
ncbi:MAG: nicotinate-nucleotide adenylyltransferase [Gemmatimonadaceae bacterium]